MAKTTIRWMLLLSFLVVIGISTGAGQDAPVEPDDNNFANVNNEGNNDVIESGDIDPDGELPEGEDNGDNDLGNVTEGGTDVYAVEMDNGKELLFNSEGAHLHTALIDSEDDPVLDVVDIPQGIKDWVATNSLGGIYDVYREDSVEEGSESFIYWVDFEDSLTAIFDSEGQLINAHYEDDDHQESDNIDGEDSGDGDTEDPTDPTFAGEPRSADGDDSGTDVYAVELDNGKELFFNIYGEHLHTALIDSQDGPALDVVDIPQGIKDWVATNALGGIYDVYRELSVEEGSNSFIYWVDFEDSLIAIFDSEGQLINAHYEDDDHQEGEGEHPGEDGEEHPEGGDPTDPTDPNYTGGPGEGPDGEDTDGEHPENGGPGPADGGDSGTDVYAVKLDNGKELFFNVDGEHLHTALIDSQDGPALDVVDIPNGITEWVATNALGGIYDVYRELSVEEGSNSFIYWVDFEDSLIAIFDNEGQLINAHYEDDDHQEGEGEHPGEDGEGHPEGEHPEGGDPTDPTDPNYTGGPGEGPDSEGPDGEHPEDGGPGPADGGDSGTDVYAVELDNGKELFFNVDGEHLHTALIDSQDGPALDVVDIPQGIMDWVASNALGGIYDVYREHSVEAGPESFIYWVDFEDGLTAMFNKEGELINAHYEGHGPGGEGDGEHPQPWEPEKWKPFELPQVAKDYLNQQYPGIHFWADEVDGPDGGKEIIVFLDNGLDATFDSDGNHLKTVDPWEEKLQNVTPGLKLSTTSSTWATADGSSSGAFTLDAATGIYSSSEGNAPAYAALQYEANTGVDATGSDTAEPAEGEEGEGDDVAAPVEEDFHQGSRLYTLVFTNSQPDGSAPSAAEGNLASTDLVAGTTLSLTFTYEFGPIRYIGLNGAELTSFTHTEPDWENDGSFTVTVKTVNPPASTSDPDGTVVESSFGMIVEMGGEYWYDGAIFMTDVFWNDMSQPKYTSPWEPVAAFNIAGQDGAAANFTAYLPINLIQGQFAVWRPQDLSAAVLKSDGSMAFIAGSTDDGSMPTTGSSWTLTPYEGERPGPGQPAGGNPEPEQGGGENSSLGDLDNGGGPVELAASFIDFNGNGHKDPLLVVSFSNDSWSDADIQLGDPFLDPYANLDKSSYGSISGTISATDGSFPPDYDVWLIEAVEDSNDPYEGKPAFMEYEAGDNGTYTIKVGPGTYYLEAVAFDFENDIPYKPRMHRDESGNPLTLTITDSSTIISGVNFSLKQEFRQTGGRGKVKGRIVNADGHPVREANIEVFPVDEEGEILSDHPVGNGWVEPNGSYTLEAPSGLMKLIISTWDNSFTAQESTITIPANDELTGQDFTMAARGAGTVTGSITDADDNPVWAEVIFIDAGDEDRFVWPKEFLMEKIAGEITGNYTATIPAGEYKIYVKRWDGALLPAYYSDSAVTGADDFDEATTVTVGENATSEDISIQLQARPTATVTFKVLNSADSTNVADAFVAFTDSEDEWGGVFFPHLEVSEDGAHTVKAPGGTYKVEIQADGYESIFYTVDASGEHALEGTTWEEGATLSLTDGETTDLGSASLTALATTEEDNIKWLDFGDAPGAPTGATLSGKVITPEGDAVPRAQIIARTDDNLLRLDHVMTKPDGTFTLNKLPRGNWIVFALPPFESKSYRGYQESDEIELSLNDGDEESDQTLTLTASNVSGRVMFSKKTATGGRETVPLGHGFIWAFTDEDGDGNPDSSEEDLDEFVEEFVELNKDGYFTLNLNTTGAYTLYVEIPPEHRASDPGAISFSVTNPDELIQVGNAVEISWSTKLSATGFSIERKASTSTSYKSLLSSDLSSSTRSYIDTSITPGETYVYRVTATLSSGNVTLEDTDVSQTDPFVYLAPSSKIITGTVVDGDGNTISGAEIFAASKKGFIETTTDDTGSYELTAGPGTWKVNLRPARGVQATWVYEGFPEEIEFVEDATSESTSVNFEVAVLGNGKITGTILKADGSSDWTGLTDYVEVNAFSPSGEGNATAIGADGTFEILLPAGGYDVSVWINHEQFPTYKPPAAQHVRVANAAVVLGNITLGAKSSKISGNLTDADGNALPNFSVSARSKKTGAFISDTTNAAGQYELNVDAGAWEVMFELPIAESGAEIPYLMQKPKRVKVSESQIKSLDFTVDKAASSIGGTVVDSSGNPITDLDLFVYVRNAAANAGLHAIVNEAEVDSRGKFTLSLSDGEYAAGVWVPQGSGFRPDAEATFTISGGEVSHAEGVTALSLTLLSNDAVISGTLNLNETAVSGIKGDVFAVSSEGWEETSIQSEGTYSLTLGPGDWNIGYRIVSDSDTSRTILPSPAAPTRTTAVAGATVTQDFSLKTAGATITGTILDENGAQLTDSTVYIWTARIGDPTYDDYETEVESTDGTFSLSVEAGGVYQVGAYLPPELRESGYLEPRAQPANISATGTATVSLTLEKPAEENFIEGNIATGESTIEGAYVYAWSDDGQFAEGETDEDGNYKLLVPSGSTWHVGSDFVNVDDEGTETIYITDNELSVDLSASASSSAQNIILAQPDFEVPDGAADTFDATKDFTTVLEDGTEIYIPANAVPVEADADGNSEVRFVVTPYTEGLVKNANDQPLDYGYQIKLYDSAGKEISQEFNKAVTMTMAFDPMALAADGINSENLNISFFNSTKNAWENADAVSIDAEAGKIFASVTHFSDWANTATPDTTAPIITLIGDASVTISAGDTYTDAGASASDDTDGDITANITTGGAVNANTPGTYTLSYDLSDAAGNAATQVTRTVTVQDTTAPAITLIGEASITFTVGGTYSEPGASASDNVDDDITANIVTSGDTVDANTAGTYTITFNVSDTAGNAATQVTRSVVVEAATGEADTTVPVITLVGDNPLVLEVDSTYTNPGATATDNIDGVITDSITVGGDTVDSSVTGTYSITYNVSDAAGNAAAQVTRTVTVQDTTAPVITVTGDAAVTITVGDVYTDAGATASDGNDGDISANITVGGDTIDINAAGTYDITYNVNDAAGNAATTAHRSLVVQEPTPVDTTAPVITVTGDATVTITVGDVYTDAGATASDDTDDDISANISISGDTVDVNTAGTYNIAYDVYDAAGNAATTAYRVVIIGEAVPSAETTPPVLTLAGDATVIISVGGAYIDAGATATDDTDGDISANIVLGGDTVDINTAGSYTLTYNVSDAAGNAATTVSQTVIVQPVYASGEGESGAGAVILVNLEGDVRVQNLQTNNYLETEAVAEGKSISAGHSVETGDQAKATLLFSNGSVTTLTGKSKLSILEFSQTAFAGGTETLGFLKEEPSSSTTQLELLYGDLVFDVLKLNEISSYVLNSPVGKTVIKGTIGQLNVTTNADGTVSGGINMVEGLVSYTDPSGNSADVPASQGTVVQVSAAGSQIGTTQNIAVSTAASAAIANTATASATAAAGVSLNQLATQALATMQSSLTVFVNVPVISRQTGLMNQVLRVENKTSATIDAFKLTFSNLKDVKNIYNRTGTDAEGNNYVEIPQTLNSGDAIDVAVSYYPTVHSVSEIPATVTVAAIDINTIWDGAANVGDGWLKLDWFDLFNADQFPWIFHPAMGWIYMLGNDSDNLWMWHPELGWHWTSKSVYPQIYLANDTAWAFLSTANATTQIYNYQTGEWGVLAP